MRRGVLVGAAVAAAVAGWLWFWPASLGGQTTYVTTHGTSMEPAFHTGDLALVRPAGPYAVGDVVAYRSALLHTVVMHRIVAVQDGRYTFKGDNNAWLDPEHPGTAELVGRLAVHVPQGGAWLDRLTSPPGLGLGLFALLATGGAAAGTRHRRRRRLRRASMSRHITAPPLSRRAPRALAGRHKAVAAAALALGAAGAGLGAWSWTGPLERAPAAAASDTARMTFSYAAAVPASPAYDGTAVTSPDPVFRRLADTVQVRYSYQGQPGTSTVTAELSTASGWHSTIPLAGPARFTGTSYQGSVPLDLQALDARAQAAATAIGIPAGTVSVAVAVHIQGADGRTFQPALKLSLTPLQLSLADGAGDLASTDTGGTTTTAAPVPRTLGAGGWSITAATGRALSAALLAAGLLGAALAYLARARAGGEEGAAIRRRHSSLLVRVHPVPTAPGRPVVDVAAFSALAKLAERYGLLVLHWTRSGIETFIVQDESGTYRYRTGSHVPQPGSTEADGPVPTPAGSGTLADTDPQDRSG